MGLLVGNAKRWASAGWTEAVLGGRIVEQEGLGIRERDAEYVVQGLRPS